MRHVISILVEDKFGALARIVDMFTSRGYNLESICSGVGEEEGTHRMTVVATGDDRVIAQIIKHLKNLVYVFDVTDLQMEKSICRELLLMRVRVTPQQRFEILNLISSYEGRIVEMNNSLLSFEVVGRASKLDGLLEVFRAYDIVELARTGEAAIHH